MGRPLKTVKQQIANAVSSFSNVTGCAPSDLYLGREEMGALAQDSEGGWIVLHGRVTYRGLTVNEITSEAHIGVGFSR